MDLYNLLGKDNIQSWNELQYYFGKDLSDIPVIMCLNKRDLHELISKNEVIDVLKLDSYSKIKFTETIASQGKGILDAFTQMLGFILPASNLII